MKELTVRNITRKYIKETYNLDKHRGVVRIPKYINSVDITDLPFHKISPQVFFDFFRDKFKNSDLIELIVEYDYTGFKLYENDSRAETDHEVVLRLQKEQKSILQERNKEIKQRAEFERLKVIYGE